MITFTSFPVANGTALSERFSDGEDEAMRDLALEYDDADDAAFLTLTSPGETLTSTHAFMRCVHRRY
jgi:hypothetical protein